jgi:RND family efflux transporter MFP subunit
MGIVAEKYVDNYQNVKAKESILSLQDISKVEIVADIPETDMAKGKKLKNPNDIDKYLQAKVEFPAFADKDFPLKAKEFNAQADSVTQTFKVVFVMDNPSSYRILPGMTAVLKMKEDFFNPRIGSKNLFYLPSNSVFEGSDKKKYVWVVNNNMTVSKREVETGSLTGSDIEVLNGLKPGEKIVTAGVSRVHDGMKVRKLENIGGKKIK